MSPKYLQQSLGSISLTVWEQTWFEYFQDGHPGYWNRMILAMQNLYVAPMPPIKLQLNLIYSLRRDVSCRFSRWPTGQPSWISEQNDFSNSNSPCGPNASHQICAQSDLGFRSRCGFKIFKMASWAAILDIRTELFLQF